MDKSKRFNAWQLLGVILILVGLSYAMYDRLGRRPATPTEPAMPPQQLLPAASQPVPTH
jgi:hypothetical protein